MNLYDTVGNRISMTDTTGETAYTYDIMGRVTSVTSADGRKVQYAYDDCGRLGAITYADGRTVSYAYDLNDRLVSVADGDKVTEYAYDALGRVTETARPNGTKTTYAYDVRGNLTELVNKKRGGSMISAFAYTYNEQGYITKEVARDADSTVIREYTYNLSGELVKFIEKEGWKVASYTYSYDDSGNRIKLQKAGIDRPETVTYQYNAANQLISQTSTIDGTTHYEYNKNGSLILEQTAGKEDITYEYTVEQRLAVVRQGGALLMAASYDGDGNRVFQISRGSSEQYAQKADPDQNVDTLIRPGTDTVTNVGPIPNGNQSAENPTITDDDLAPIPGASGTAQAEVYTYYEKVYADPADTIFWYGFGQGMLQFFGNLNAALSAYLSDWFCHAWDFVTGQYELVVHSEAVVSPYSGEDVETLRGLGLSEEEIADITGGSVDATGKVAVGYVPNEAADSKTAGSTTTQALDQPIGGDTIVIPENPSQTERVDYELTYYVNDVNTENAQVLMEYGKRDELKNVYTYGNERISADTIADTFNAVTDDIQTDYYLYDGRGSVANVVSVEAEVLSAYTYDPFGNVTSGAPEFDSFYGYNAEDTNPVTGLQYLRARYYDTESGRFAVRDSVLGDISAPLTLNRYTYVINNPLMYVDTSGEWLHALIGAAVGAVVGAVTGAASEVISAVVEQRPVDFKQMGVNALSGAAGGAVSGAVFAATGSTTLASVAGGAVGGAVGGFAGTLANGGNVKDVFANAGKGAIAGAAGGLVGGAFGGAVGSVLGKAAGAVVGAVAGGSTGQYVGTRLNGGSVQDAWKAATDPKKAVTNVLTGLTGYAAYKAIGVPLETYLENKTAQIQAEVQKYSCGSAEKMGTQDPVDDVTPDVPDNVPLDSPDDVVDIELKFKEGWTDAQKAEAIAKMEALTKAKTVKTTVERNGTSASAKYKSANGADSVPDGYDVDHTIDLQLGGNDVVTNMSPLDSSVNRSLGPQIYHAIKNYPDGTIFGKFTIK